jgi:hypothetical protein
MVVMIALLAIAGPASATTILREHYSGSDTFSYSDCGFEVAGVVEFSGVAHIRVGTGKDLNAFFAHDNYRFREVHTRVSTGDFFVVSGNGMFQETRATRVSGSIFEFSAVNAGQVFTVTDSSGNVVVRDRGVVRETILFDTLGDDTPGGTFIESVSLEFGGPHPGFDFDTCTLLD